MNNKIKLILIISLVVLICSTLYFLFLINNKKQKKVTFNNTQSNEQITSVITPRYTTGSTPNNTPMPLEYLKSIGEPFDYSTPIPRQGAKADTRSIDLVKDEQEFQRQNHTDVYLSNFTPYETGLFSIFSDYKPEPTGHFYFLIYLKGESKVKSRNAVIGWMKNLKLTDEQISKLEIQYYDQ
ncbi:MAG TPA: hypothetical protein VK338_04300 [Candidatus Nitrosocosmicus sp.]|nr:hypothetical protein [Candidatus Nitrosocosmicus sp.]